MDPVLPEGRQWTWKHRALAVVCLLLGVAGAIGFWYGWNHEPLQMFTVRRFLVDVEVAGDQARVLPEHETSLRDAGMAAKGPANAVIVHADVRLLRPIPMQFSRAGGFTPYSEFSPPPWLDPNKCGPEHGVQVSLFAHIERVGVAWPQVQTGTPFATPMSMDLVNKVLPPLAEWVAGTRADAVDAQGVRAGGLTAPPLRCLSPDEAWWILIASCSALSLAFAVMLEMLRGRLVK
ncbi:MAG TPA: hypothetical protein VHC70_00955 [Phycisphaerales bacterium]|nr:hypothetical protein [Phycisphaerales bacterium]